jgi:hypothetical protein
MDVGEFSAARLALDVCARPAISGQTIMRLILGVFGIAAVLIAVWAILWIFAKGKKS